MCQLGYYNNFAFYLFVVVCSIHCTKMFSKDYLEVKVKMDNDISTAIFTCPYLLLNLYYAENIFPVNLHNVARGPKKRVNRKENDAILIKKDEICKKILTKMTVINHLHRLVCCNIYLCK